MSEWQPIETAPKDGTDIILYAKGLVMAGAYVCFYDGPWGWKQYGEDDPVDPSHWMPLPEPPNE